MATRTKQEKPVGIRLPRDLRDYVEARARENFRSLSAEVAHRVERSRQLDQAAQTTGGAQ